MTGTVKHREPAGTESTIFGQWIWCSGEERPKNFYLHVRRSLECRSGLRKAEIDVTADSRYQLFVNGVRVAAGPARCDRRWQCLDRWDVTRFLRPGPNVVAALVHHYGEWTFAYMLGRAGFLADLALTYGEGKVEHVGTDASWRVRPADAWDRRLPRISIQLGFGEIYDARKEFEGWGSHGFDDSGWQHATVLGPPGMEPWPHLVPRDIPAMKETPCHPVRVIDSGCVSRPAAGHYIDLQRVVWSAAHGVGFVGTFVWSPEDMLLEIHAGSQESVKVWFNGALVVSRYANREPAPDQEIVPVQIRKGWNSVLAKVVQDGGQWHFYFRLDGKGTDRCIYARSQEPDPPLSGDVAPWWLLGPVPAESMKAGFDTPYPPEFHWATDAPVTLQNGGELRWMSAGVSQETQLVAVIMSREQRCVSGHPRITNPSGLIGPGHAKILPGDEHGTYAVIDFGKEVTGFPVLEIAGAEGGEIIDIGYAEALSGPDGALLPPAEGTRGIVDCDRARVHYADRYICKPGKQQFRTFDKRAFRYMQVDVRALRQPLHLGPVSLLLCTYPVEYEGHFECPDPVLNKIWEVGRWTVQLNMEDAYTDCPWRERGQWWGDARIQALVNYYAFGDLALIKRGLRTVAQSQDAEGWTRGIYPTDWSFAVLPTFSLLWIISLHDYVLHSGDRTLPEECFGVVERVIQACETRRAAHGLLRDMPHWLFVDWAEVDTTGESASVNALYYGALRASAGIAQFLDRPEVAQYYDTIAAAVRSGMSMHLWDAGRKCFRESWRQDILSEQISEQANSWAVAFGAVDQDRAVDIMNAITRDACATVRTGTPYFAFYVLEMLGKTGNHRAMLEYIRSRWTPMLDWGATTWWETWEPKASLCHGWSAAPTYFLQSEILGVKPAQPGWEEIRIEPHPGDLAWLRGVVPSPRGPISVEWRKEKGFMLRIDVPAKTRVRLRTQECGDVTVHRGSDGTECDLERLEDDQEHRTFVVSDPGVYRFFYSPFPSQ